MAEVFRMGTMSQITLDSNLGLAIDPYEIHTSWLIWCIASINKHFMDRKGPYNLYLEGDERVYQDEEEFAELRIDGPFILQASRGLYFVNVEINVLIQSHMDNKDLYKLHRAVGVFTKAFTNAICVYKYGDGILDDGSLLGMFRLLTDTREKVEVNHYGIIKEDVRMMQSTVEGHYRLELWNTKEIS